MAYWPKDAMLIARLTTQLHCYDSMPPATTMSYSPAWIIWSASAIASRILSRARRSAKSSGPTGQAR
jgi:hypothetical protein